MFDLARVAAHSFVAQLEHRDEVGSTNDLALELAAAGRLATPALVLAERQTAGRGRGANRWWAADGALTFSLALDPSQMNVPAERWPQVSLATAVAIVTALEPFAPGVRFGVKWPNDVHAGGKKISGILVEAPNLARSGGVSPPETPSTAAGSRRYGRRIIVGVGVNVNNSWADAPPELRAVGASLGDLTGGAYDMTDVLLAVLEEIEDRLGQLADRDPRLADAWQSLCVLRGRHVEIDLGQRRVAGACAGIDADGALVLDQPAGAQRLFGGTVRSIR